ncbi:hypothetical protein EDD86DRAFT_197110 [Gorgonomyces haynaldii]|nr:hypothetical protein EDD86DRAFT_197110 [Gorgonomyces haynaldii]
MVRFVVGIDFGTTYSGFAWAKVDNPNEIRGPDQWENQSVQVAFIKAPTSVRYKTSDLSFDSWGYKSRTQISKIKSGELVEETMFKLYFNPDVERHLHPGIHWMTPSIDYLREISQKAIQTIEKTFGAVAQDDISWCITVPAFWSEASKASVREACAHAGIGVGPLREHLSIILEPEAAALYCMRKVQDINLKHGDSFMICDAGGGTVDLTMHQYQVNGLSRQNTRDSRGSDLSTAFNNMNVSERDVMDFSLIEKTRGSGDFCGSKTVDDAFLQLFANEITIEKFRLLLQEKPHLVEQFKVDWESAKRTFGGSTTAEHELIAFPNGMLRFIGEETKRRWQQQHGTEDEFYITREQMASCFTWAIDRTCDLINNQLRMLEPGDTCDTLILVGGFSASPHLEAKIRERFSTKFKRIIVPVDPASAVVQGAVHFGLKPSAIPVRRARMSYGFIAYARPEAMRTGVHQGDVAINRRDGQTYCRVFKCMVHENQPIEETEVFEKEAVPFGTNQEDVIVELVATPHRVNDLFTSLSFVPDLQVMATIRADVSAASGEARRAIVRLNFGKTEIQCTILNCNTGVTRRVNLDYGLTAYTPVLPPTE